MDNEMFSCFPKGIRALLVDEDPKFLNSVTIALSSLHYNVVATCRSPISAVKLLSSGKVKDVDVILADAHKVASCGFNLRTVVENDLCIPVIYFMSLEAPPPPAGDEADKLAATVQSSTFIIKKPLDMSEATNLWRVVAWHKCKLKAGRAGGGCYRGRDDTATAVAGESRPPSLARHDDANDHDPGTEENHVHFKVVRARGRRRNNHAGAGGSQQRRTVEQMNVTAGIRRHHIGSMPSPLEEYHRAKLQKNNANCSTSSHVALPTCNTRSHIPRTYADDNASGSRMNATTSSSDDVSTLFPPWPPVFQELAGNNADFANIAAPAAVAPAPLEHQQPATIAGPSNVDLATRFTHRSAQVAATPLTYRTASVATTPIPERPSSATAAAVIGDAGPTLRGDDSRLVASTLNLGAAPSEAAIELLLNISKPHMVPAREAASTQPCSKTSASAAAPRTPLVAPSQFPVAAAVEDENEVAAAMVAELVAAPDNGVPAAASHDQGDEQLQTTEGDWTFSLEDLQGLDIPGDMRGGGNTVDGAPLSFLNGYDDIGNWGLLTDQDFFHLDDIMGDTDDHTTLNDTTKEQEYTQCLSNNTTRDI